MKIFLDDQLNEPGMPNRQAPVGYTGVRNFDEFRKVLEEALARGEKIEALDFDNDLGGGMEGWEIAKWLAENHPEIFEGIGELRAHSENPAGRKKIEDYFEQGRLHWKELIEARKTPHPFGGELKNR